MHSSKLFLYSREKDLVALLWALDAPVDDQTLQLLLCLFYSRREATLSNGSVTSRYEFVPTRFGAHSFTIGHNHKRLITKEIVEDTLDVWTLTPRGRDIAKRLCTDEIQSFAKQHGALRGSTLIATTYRNNPFTATRSLNFEEVLVGDPVSQEDVRAVIPKPRHQGLCTVGYQQRTLEGFINILLSNSVTTLCDVRHNARSRNYGFSKTVLNHACGSVGIDYWHLPQLGIEGQYRKGLNDKESYRKLFMDYRLTTIPKVEDTLDSIQAKISAGECVALTCYEREPEECHRAILADSLLSSVHPVNHPPISSAMHPIEQPLKIQHL